MTGFHRFSAADVPTNIRQPAWNEVLARLGLVSRSLPQASPDCSTRTVMAESATGSVFLNLSTSQQQLQCRSTGIHSASTVLVLAVLDGTIEVLEGTNTLNLGPGNIHVLDLEQNWQIAVGAQARLMLIRLVSSSFLRRLLRTGSLEANRIRSQEGVGALYFSLIESLATQLPNLSGTELATLEVTLAELLVTSLSHQQDDGEEDTTSVQLAHLRRICRNIDTRLDQPDLGIDQIAAQEGLSARYIQKLFRNSNTTFSEYLKSRRIQHCCIDLANPALARFSISELCFRWGFTDAANFSRTFSHHMGMSPKAYRASPPMNMEEQLRRGCPPHWESYARTSRGRTHDPDNPRQPFVDLLQDHARYMLSLKLAPKRVSKSHNRKAPDSPPQDAPQQFYLPASDKSVHWGYFSRDIPPVLTVRSGDQVTIETLSQHASDDSERMIQGDPGAESVFHWTPDKKNVDRRGAGPEDASIFGRGAGEGFGVHICTGPVYIQDAEPGDVLEIRIRDIRPRPSCHPSYRGRNFGSNAATWWGFQYDDLLTEPRKREVVTLYEVHHDCQPPHARAVYNFRWTPQTDPYGVRHDTIDYPGVPVDHGTISKQFGILDKARVPVRPHFGVLAVAPRESGHVDSIPPSYFGGNMDNWRAGKGATLFLPVAVKGALFSVGDPHASQGDSELCGTAIECSLTGTFQFIVHKRKNLAGQFLENLGHPFLETPNEWVIQGLSYPDYQAELGARAQTQVYKDSTLEAAMRDAFRKTRHYLIKAHQLSEDEAISLISVAVDFGITQVVDGNLGVHAVIPKSVIPEHASSSLPATG